MTTHRLELFSDGVFAIAVTLLVLEIKPPEGENLGRELLDLWPSYAAYVTSFFTIGIIWVSHHFQFDRTTNVDRPTMFINLFLLMIVAFIPFPTAVLAQNLQSGQDIAAVAAAFYAGTLFLMSLSFNALAEYIRHRGLIVGELPEELIHAFKRKGRVGLVGYLLAVGLAFVSPYLSLALCGAIAIFFALPGRKISRLRAEMEARATKSDAAPAPPVPPADDR
jgi:uncharacterized membrane protein